MSAGLRPPLPFCPQSDLTMPEPTDPQLYQMLGRIEAGVQHLTRTLETVAQTQFLHDERIRKLEQASAPDLAERVAKLETGRARDVGLAVGAGTILSLFLDKLPFIFGK